MADLSVVCGLSGILSPVIGMSGTLSPVIGLSGELSTRIESEERIAYHGAYEVTPKMVEQRLETEGLVMLHDVEVHKVPTFEVSNNTGETLYIASEV